MSKVAIKKSLCEAKIIAHRGAPKLAPENTMSAFQRAHQLGARWVEFDVMLTKDDVPIIMHDITLDRTTSGSGPVEQFSFEEIHALDAGSWYSYEFAGERVPTFEDVLIFCRDHELLMNVEIKPTPGRGPETARAAIELLQAHWPMDSYPLLLSSSDLQACQSVAECAPELLVASVVHTIEEIDMAHPSPVASVNHEIITAKVFDRLKTRFDIILPYTVNDQERARALLSMGVDAVFSDHPDLL